MSLRLSSGLCFPRVSAISSLCSVFVLQLGSLSESAKLGVYIVAGVTAFIDFIFFGKITLLIFVSNRVVLLLLLPGVMFKHRDSKLVRAGSKNFLLLVLVFLAALAACAVYVALLPALSLTI